MNNTDVNNTDTNLVQCTVNEMITINYFYDKRNLVGTEMKLYDHKVNQLTAITSTDF